MKTRLLPESGGGLWYESPNNITDPVPFQQVLSFLLGCLNAKVL